MKYLILLLISSIALAEAKEYPKFLVEDLVKIACKNHISNEAKFNKCDTTDKYTVVDFIYEQCVFGSNAECYAYVLEPYPKISTCRRLTVSEECLKKTNL